MTSNAPGPDEGPQQNRPPGFDPHTAAGTLTHPEGLRRSRTDRKVAGVCGGLGRQLGIDPTIIRVLMVVLALAGGIGLPLYVVLWIVMPEQGSDRSVLDSPAAQHLPPQVRSGPGLAILIAAVVLVASGIFSGWFGHSWFSFRLPLPLLVVAGLVVFFVHRAKRNGAEMPAWVNRVAASATRPAPTEPAPAAATGRLHPEQPIDPDDPGAPGAQFWSRPDPLGLYPDEPAPVPVVAPAQLLRRRRAPWTLVLGTVVVAGISVAVLSVIAAAGVGVAPLLFAAVPAAVLGIGLLLASRLGGSRLLVTLAVVLGLTTVGATRLGDSFDSYQHRLTPTTLAQAQALSPLPNGYHKIDLTNIDFPNKTTTLNLSVDKGVIDVVLPADLDTRVDAEVHRGAWNLFGAKAGAQNNPSQPIVVTDFGADGRTTDRTRLDLDLTVAGTGLVHVGR